MLLAMCFNSFAPSMLLSDKLYSYRRKKQNLKEKNINSTSEKGNEHFLKQNKILFYIVLITMIFCIICPALFIFGNQNELDRKNYKIILEEVDSSSPENNPFCFSVSEKSFLVFIIIYEDEDKYILSRIYKNVNGINIDYNYQKNIDKIDIKTYYIDNIKDLDEIKRAIYLNS